MSDDGTSSAGIDEDAEGRTVGSSMPAPRAHHDRRR